jgi:hypothetical protein|tara:strand:+ start:735 stop:1196 length:462 start_codon:yes stop_codon:yes gene_type:complete
MKLKQSIYFLAVSTALMSCSANKIVFPTQIEYSTYSQRVVDTFIPYIESMGYTVLNPMDTRMTMQGPSGFMTAEYIETDWFNTGVKDQDTGNEFIVKQKVWILVDSPVITVETVYGYLDGEEMIVFESAPPALYSVVKALPEGLNNLVSSKAL